MDPWRVTREVESNEMIEQAESKFIRPSPAQKRRERQEARGEKREAHGKRCAKRGVGEERRTGPRQMGVRGQVQLRSSNQSERATVPLGAR